MSGASIPAWAVRGAPVVCIAEVADDPRNYGLDSRIAYPALGEIYTVREVLVRYVPEWSEVLVGVRVAELRNPIAETGSGGGEEIAFDIRLFAPVQRVGAKASRKVREPA